MKKRQEYKYGEKMGNCVFIEEIEPNFRRNGNSVRIGVFQCECSQLFKSRIDNIKRGYVKSCGCMKINSALAKITHGKYHTTEYKIWAGIKKRCYNVNDKIYSYYGGRGITMCDRWRDNFQNFLDDVGLRPSDKHSADRFPDKNGNYERENFRWATDEEQCNNRRSSKYIEFNGKTLTQEQWSRKTGLSKLIEWRLKQNWEISKVFSPPRKSKIKLTIE